ncbi:LAFA_0G17942g1_1 [Lachancea sp. 'fantastica']|nr:LAFA_0G17942g1_1 [Lachancea sp. 'fantastica']
MQSETARLAFGRFFENNNWKKTGEATTFKESDDSTGKQIPLNAAENNFETVGFLRRRGRFTRSFKKAKQLLDKGFGYPSHRANDNTKECPREQNNTRLVSLLGRNHLNSTRGWLLTKSKPSFDGKENDLCEPCDSEKKVDRGPRDLDPHDMPKVLAEKKLDIFDYLSPEQVEKGELFMTLGESECGPFDKDLKQLYLDAMRDSIQQNGKWISSLEFRMVEFQERFNNHELIAFLKHLQNLLKYETGFLQEIHDRYDLLFQENSTLRAILNSSKRPNISKLNER